MREEDAEIGLLALERGWVTQDALNGCLLALSEDSDRTLSDLLLERKLLDAGQLEALREEALRRIRERSASSEAEAAPAPSEEPSEVSAAIPAEAARAAQDPRRLFGRYIRVAELGKIGTGRVWKAWDTQRRQWVALKLFRFEGGEEEVLERFLQEARASLGLEHPGIVPVYEVGRQAENYIEWAYVAMEYVDGETLDQVRARGVTAQRAAQIIRDAALAVACAHERGVLHRNIQPCNIMVGFDGAVRVLDFGLAKLTATLAPGDDSVLSRTIAVQGTPSYMPPEQALGRTGDIRERSDVYSLGATLFFLLTGRPPFEGSTPMKTCFSVVRDPLPLPSQLNPSVKPDLERVVVRAMAKDPVRRYESAKALAEDLDRFLSGVPVLTDDQMRFTQGLAALGAGRLEEAIHMFKELIRLEAAPKGAPGEARAMHRQLEEGEAGLTLAIGQQPRNYDIRTQRGVYRFAGAILKYLEGSDPSARCKAAMEDFVEAAALRPEYTPARVNRANVLLFGGRYARDSGKDVSGVFAMALKDLDAAIGFDPTCSPAYHNRGIVRFYMAQVAKRAGGDPEGDLRAAAEDFARAAELEPTYAYIFKDLGVVKVALAKHLLARGEKVKTLFEEAVAHLDQAVQLNAALHGAFYERGQAHFALKNFKAAIRDFRRCLELDPGKDRPKIQALIEEAQKHAETRRV
jgi:tetratricopeptide (TPR) repeat protein